jgi:hypothetical protein
MFGELLESREGVSRNRGTDEDMRDSRQVVEWLETPKGHEAKRRVAGALIRIWNKGQNSGEE